MARTYRFTPSENLKKKINVHPSSFSKIEISVVLYTCYLENVSLRTLLRVNLKNANPLISAEPSNSESGVRYIERGRHNRNTVDILHFYVPGWLFVHFKFNLVFIMHVYCYENKTFTQDVPTFRLYTRVTIFYGRGKMTFYTPTYYLNVASQHWSVPIREDVYLFENCRMRSRTSPASQTNRVTPPFIAKIWWANERHATFLTILGFRINTSVDRFVISLPCIGYVILITFVRSTHELYVLLLLIQMSNVTRKLIFSKRTRTRVLAECRALIT